MAGGRVNKIKFIQNLTGGRVNKTAFIQNLAGGRVNKFSEVAIKYYSDIAKVGRGMQKEGKKLEAQELVRSNRGYG